MFVAVSEKPAIMKGRQFDNIVFKADLYDVI
jgi:hypothetical protein